MAGGERLYLYCDPALDGDFRRRFERALGGLKVDTADGDLVDPDPDNPGVVMALASSAGGWSLPARADIIVQAGPGDFPSGTSALRLEASDIDSETARWSRLVERLRGKLGLASLALPAEDLAEMLDREARRANEAERAMATALLNEGNAARERDALRVQLAEARSRAQALEAETEHLRRMNDAGAFALGLVPESARPAVERARDAAWRAQAAAAQAVEKAAAFPGVFAWDTGASYSGEHRNGRPHGFGVMTFRQRGEVFAYYRGQFVDGRRAGQGVGMSEDGLLWSGEWKDDEACGHGVLEARDGQRFEGEARPDGDGAPKAGDGWAWASAGDPARTVTHQPVNPRLPAPQPMAD